MPVARDSDAVAFDIDIMKPTPWETSSLTIGHVPFVIASSSRVFAVACSSIARWESFRYSFHSATSRSAAGTTWSAGTAKISAVRRSSSAIFRTASSAPLPATYSRRTTPSLIRVDRRSLMRDTSLVREGVVVRDVQTREVLSFVSPGLPHVVPQGLPSRAEDDMGRGVVPHERLE